MFQEEIAIYEDDDNLRLFLCFTFVFDLFSKSIFIFVLLNTKKEGHGFKPKYVFF